MGVDVFFVISGYLITAILLTEIEQDRFSLWTFYERRARRILPALFVVLLACLPFAWAWMLPEQLEAFGKSLMAVMLFGSNILFWRETGYFAPAAEEKPLLHTWSLAVEEQYYLIVPLILMFGLRRFGRDPTFWGLVILSLISLALCEIGRRSHPSAAFYLAPTRAWELLAGSLCAFLQRREGRQRSSQIWSGLGLGMICASVLVFDGQTPFPSLYALVPVLGTVLIILFATPDTLAGRILTFRGFVGIGLISYSAYLWHQPLFAFARIRTLYAPEMTLMLGLALLSLGLAYITWRFIEAPFRGRPSRLLPHRNHLFTASFCGMVGFGILGAGLVLSGGAPNRLQFDAEQIAYLETATSSPKRADCHTRGASYLPPAQACSYFADPATVAVFCDSHAVELAYALAETLEPRGLGVRHLSFSNCAPIYEPDTPSSDCARWTRDSLAWLKSRSDITHVVVTYRIHAALHGLHEHVWPAQPDLVSVQERDRIIADLLQILKTLDETKTVIFLLQAPEAPATAAKTIKWAGAGADRLPGVSREWWETRQSTLRAHLNALATHATLVDPTELFCDETACSMGQDGIAYYFDDDHMSLSGARKVAAEILPLLDGVLR